MELETAFTLANSVALISWVLLFVFYPRPWVYRVLFSVILVFLALFYLIYVIPGLITGGEGDFNSLAGVKSLFDNDEAVLAGWIHYLAFDLFTGMWITQDAFKRGFGRWLILPCLLFTFMLGPTGLLLYFLYRVVKQRRFLQDPYLKWEVEVGDG
ncbi:ABA4-like family protein [Pleomorphovibrio marinus]|uniref:ABA4-like family protein n=1 Tax=Pleomorphovibrio marinus TaxID=2164132 RepID=UPI000E0A7EF7|nr:ABA4-like family protein [Pleomorphovibrio marinus]